MTTARIHFVQCLSPAGLHAMAYKEWGDPRNPKVLMCVHGVTRVADDFDLLAQEMCDSYRVVCPDIVGRGRSDWLTDPQCYRLPQYLSDVVTLVARLNVEQVDWVGTSMGGLIGILLASLKASPVRSLVLNDIGPELDRAAIARIGEYIGQDRRFGSFDEAEAYIRAISVSFGPHTEAQWHKIAADVLRQDAQGRWTTHYDPQLALAFKSDTDQSREQARASLWAAYETITCPTLLMRGAQSDLLKSDTAQGMTVRGPLARLMEFPGVGHAPTLVTADQIAVVRNFLLR